MLDSEECNDHVKACTALSEAPISILFSSDKVAIYVRQVLIKCTPDAMRTPFNTPQQLV